MAYNWLSHAFPNPEMVQPKRKNSVAATSLPRDTRNRGNQDPSQPLTEMQRMFVHHLVHNKLNQTAAARQAGFRQPATSANALMRNPKVLAAIAEERAEYARASGMTKRKVIEGFSEAIDLARIKADPIAMIAGWREIGKMCGFYEATKTKVEVSVQGQVLIQRLNTMSDEELLALAEGDPTVLEGEFTIVDDQQPST